MSGLTSAVNAALSGIDAFEEGVQTVSTNLSNETTDGYALRTLETETSAAESGAAGSGVINPAAVQRAADGLAAARFNGATSADAAAQTLSAALSAISGALQGSGDINGAASTFFGDLGTLASEPTNGTEAATSMADAGNLLAAFHAAASGLESQSDGIVRLLQQSVAGANQLLSQLAVVNGKLRASPDDNSLLDEQQQALGSLAKLIGFRTVPLGGGGIEVTANGVVLLDQSGAQALALVQPGPSSEPVLTAGTASVPIDPASTSGSIGGDLAAFGETRDAMNSLDWFAASLAGAVNEAQAEGLDGSGKQGGALFAVPPPSITAGSSNTGSAALAVSISNAADLPSNGSGYVLSYDGTGWTATVPGTTENYSLGAGPALSLPGLTIAVSGTAKAGDTFAIDPTPGAASAIALTATSPSALAAADPYVATAGVVSASGTVTDSNAGSEEELSGDVVAIPAAGASVVPGAYFGQPLTVTFTSTGAYNVSASGTTISSGTWTNGTSIAIAYPASSSASGKYWQVTLEGNPATGDIVTLSPGGADSGSNADRMASLWSRASSIEGGSLQGAILSIIGSVGSKSQAASALASDTKTNLTSAGDNLSSVAGVDPNSQAVILTQYQQAFQAASQVISIAHSMFEDLVDAI